MDGDIPTGSRAMFDGRDLITLFEAKDVTSSEIR